MRVFVFLLVLANLVFLAWTRGYLGGSDNPDAARLNQQLAADQLTVVSRDEPPGSRHEPPAARNEPPGPRNEALGPRSEAPAATATSTPVAAPEAANPAKKPEAEKCQAWTGLSLADADTLDGALAGERFATLRRVRHTIAETTSWWVFIPPLANKVEAEKKTGELKRFGVPEYFIIQDAGPNRFAISLGIFSSEQAAEDRLAALRSKGVRSAKAGPRSSARAESLTVDVSGPESQLGAAREAVTAVLPAAKAAACGKG